jgi:hypothetical protein
MEYVAIRLFDATLIGLILISLIFLGMAFLLIDIPIFNAVNPFLIQMSVLGMFLGLTFGLIGGYWYTKQQLGILSEKVEFKGLGLKKIYYVAFSGLAVFLIYSFFVFYYHSAVLGDSLITFVTSAIFTAYAIRLILVASWEKRSSKTIMMAQNKLYTVPK